MATTPPPAGTGDSIGDVVSNIDVRAVGISETEKEMLGFLSQVTKRSGLLNDAQEELNESLDDFVRMAEKNFEREKKESTEMGKRLKLHKLEAKELLKKGLEKFRQTRDPKVLQAMHHELSDWKIKNDHMEKQYDLQEAIRVGDKDRIYKLKDEMGLISRREKMMVKIKGHLGEEKSALQGIIGVGKILPLVLGGMTIIESLKAMVHASLSWKRAVADLNQAWSTNADYIKASQAIMDDIELRALGFGEEEMTQIAKLGGQLKILEGSGKKGQESMHMWAAETVRLAKVTGMATTAAGELLSTVAIRYGVGVRGIRGISAAFKSVTDTSRITADQLSSFLGTLEPIFLRLPGLSGKAKAKVTTDFVSMAGAISDVFGDPNKIGDMFGKMLDPLNEQGNIMLGVMKSMTGKFPAEVREAMKRGDFTSVYRDFSSALSRMSEDDLNRFYHQVGDAFGMSYEDLAKFAKQGKMSQKDWDALLAKTQKERKEQENYAKAVKKTTTEWDRNINTMKHVINQVWRVFGDVLLDLGKGPLEKVTSWMKQFGAWMRGPGKAVVERWGQTLKDVAGILWDMGKRALKWLLEGEPPRLVTALEQAGEAIKSVSEFVGDLVKGWDQMDDGTKAFLTGSGPELLKYLNYLGGNIGSMVDLLDLAHEKLGALMDLTGTGSFLRLPKLFKTPELEVPLPEGGDYDANRKAIMDAVKSAPKGVDVAAGVDRALQMLPPKQAKQLAAEPEIQNIFKQAEAPEAPPAMTPGVTPPVSPTPRVNPNITVGGPNVNVTSDPSLASSLANLHPMVMLLSGILDAVRRGKSPTPPGTALAVQSLGG